VAKTVFLAEGKMSFSSEIKEELTRLTRDEPCCRAVELAAFMRITGSLHFSSGGFTGLTASTSSAAVLRHYFKLCRELYGLDAEMMYQRKNRLQKKSIYTLSIPAQKQTEKLLSLMSSIDDGNSWSSFYPQKKVALADCCARRYLRGAFMAAGSVNSPEGEYHLEIIAADKKQADFMRSLLAPFAVLPKVIMRKNQTVMYLKEAEQIVDFLNVIGAHEALLSFENARVLKDVRNFVNRQNNCDNANLNKMVNSSMRQVSAIKKLERSGILEKLSPPLKKVAALRLTYPDLSLVELGQMLSPPLGKSGVNHRLRRLEEIAQKTH